MWTVMGFKRQKEYFDRIRAGGFAHAYLFSGPAMIGKKLFALDLACRISGLSPAKNPDVLIVGPRTSDGEAHIVVDDIRAIKTFLSLKPLYGSRKIVVVDDAECITEEGANAFLKVLEEPPSQALIILVTASPRLLPATILSRCQEVAFAPHPLSIVRAYCDAQSIPESDRDFLIALAGGRLGWLSRATEPECRSAIKKDMDEFNAVVRQGAFERLIYARRIAERDDRRDLVELWLRWIRAHGKRPDKGRMVMHSLIRLHYLLSQPHYNHRLAIENFLVNL